MRCSVCGNVLDEEEVVWATKSGILTATYGRPFCTSCLPAEPSLSLEKLAEVVSGAVGNPKQLNILRRKHGKDEIDSLIADIEKGYRIT